MKAENSDSPQKSCNMNMRQTQNLQFYQKQVGNRRRERDGEKGSDTFIFDINEADDSCHYFLYLICYNVKTKRKISNFISYVVKKKNPSPSDKSKSRL